MYHPPDATAAELVAGYHNADDFEFVRIQNIGPTPVDLLGVRFMLGVTFDFTTSPTRYLTPGGSLLVVANLGAFQVRYGHGCDSLIAGVYAGNLSNKGERLQLIDANGVVIRDFTYYDAYPWPEAADGDGPSLLLAEPAANPDHSNPGNWTVAALPGGLPSGSPAPQTYATWRALLWDPLNATNNIVSGPGADLDGDGLCNFLEYAFGLDPTRPSPRPGIEISTEDYDGEPHLVVSTRFSAGAQNADFLWEQSQDLVTWSSADSSLELVASETSSAGFTTRRFREITPLPDISTHFFRLRISGP